MKRLTLTSIAASTLLSISASAFAAPHHEEGPITLSAVQLENVTAGSSSGLLGFLQLNVSPVLITQIRVLNLEFSADWSAIMRQAILARMP